MAKTTLNTIKNRIVAANAYQTSVSTDTYLGIGGVVAWDGGTVPQSNNSTNSINSVLRNLFAIKKINNSDCNLVIPRVDWATGTVYTKYTESSSSVPSYVRNTKDQVFKCLDVNNATDHPSYYPFSTAMPQITINGDLPENPFISTSDGYKWKYMYTIPAGLKEKFFTREWMPVTADDILINSAVPGRLDIFNISNRGTGYLSGGSSANANIVTVTGDGSGANLVANVHNGTIVNILPASGNTSNLGQDYTYANISISGANTSTAQISAIIGPQGGHNSNPYSELGATNLMISVDFSSDENNTIPILNTFDYRQIAIIKNPRSSIDNTILKEDKYKTVSVILTNSNSPTAFNLDERAYQGGSLATSTYSGTVVYWDYANSELWLTDTVGTFVENDDIIGEDSLTSVVSYTEAKSEYNRFSGDLLYLENRDPITRDEFQTEQFKLVLSF